MIEYDSNSPSADEKPYSDLELRGLTYAIAISFALPLLAAVATDQFDAILFFFALLLPAMLITAIFASRPAVLSGGVLAWAVIIAVFAIGGRTIDALLFFFAWAPATIIAPALASVFIPMARLYSAWDVFSVACGITLATFFSLLAAFYFAMS